MNDKTSLSVANSLRPIDIEKLADEFLHGTDRNGAYYGFVEDLKQFAEAYAAKVLEDKEREIAEFKSQTNELKSLLIDARDDVAAQLDAYQELLPYKQHRYDAQKNTLDEIDKALSKTPAQSMQSVINETIEECAKVADAWENISCKDKIRALKEVK